MAETKLLAHSLTSKERSKDVLISDNVSFISLILPTNLLNGLSACGFEKPSPIQIKALPVGRCGFDLLVKSKSGTGKTLVFGLIALETIQLEKCTPQVLILAPTREIAVQIQEVLVGIGKFLEGLSVECFIGGQSLSADKANCKSCHIAVGTPGRVKQLIQDGNLSTDHIKIFVLDEADKLIEESFQNDLNEIYNTLPESKQIIMSSATYPNELQNFLKQYMRSPVIVTVELETPLLLGLRQYVKLLKSAPNVVQQTKSKNQDLLNILSKVSFVQCLIFSNYQTRAESISNFLNKNGWNSVFMSGAQTQTERLNSLADLKDFKRRILVTTDLTSRGIDAPNIDLVINYDIPMDATTYLHRMGRAGRFGSTGNCINMAFMGQESTLLQNIVGFIGGENMSIPILDDSFDLNMETISQENSLFGVVDNSLKDIGTFSKRIDDIRSSLAETNANKKRKMKKVKNCQPQQSQKMMKDDNVLMELSQLASGTFEFDKKPKEEDNLSMDISANALLRQLAKAEEKQQFSNASPQASENYLSKNKALLNVAKMLSDTDVSNSDLKDLTDYVSSINVQEKLNVMKELSDNNDIIENIFSLAYKSQISNGQGTKWQTLLPNEEKRKLFDDYRQDDDDVDDDENIDEDYDFEVEKEIEVNDCPNDYSFMEWIPVEPKANNQDVALPNTSLLGNTVSTENNCYYQQQYAPYFEQCSNSLWQTGLQFENVQTFDSWFFNDWQQQLGAIRNYVQNRIYLQEMSRHY